MENKSLKLKSSQKDNRRYLLILASNDKIEEAILKYLGVLGMAKAAYVRVNEEKGKTISAVRREALNDVRAALAMAELKVERVSGTLKGLER
jgi:RNase P/RNase MRP subunit POP5